MTLLHPHQSWSDSLTVWRCVWEFWVCVGHVHFMLFVSILFALGTQRGPSFQWNTGFNHSSYILFRGALLTVCKRQRFA